jgi:colanic acid/amylovoran biosynthesis glycosyltransferase
MSYESRPPQSAATPAGVAVQYIVTFLKPEMLHIYRQVRGLARWWPVVFCQKREHSARFPFDAVRVLRKPASHQLRRFWQKSVLRGPIMIYRREAERIAAELRAANARVLHVYFGHIGVHLLPLLEICPVPVVVSFHGADAQIDLHRPRHRAATLRMFELARLLLVRSASLAERLVALGCPKEKIRVHRTGIPLDEIAFAPRTAPADGAWRCVQACRLIAKKGLATSLRAFAEFAQRWPRATFTIAGEGPQLEELRALAAELGIAEKVAFPGFLSQPELRALNAAAHFFLHPSELGPDGNQEGVPNAMLEAMAAGLPVLATTHGGIPEAVVHGESGVLVPERDAAGLGREMLALAEDAARFSAMSRAAAARVAAEFDLRATVRALEGFYDEAVRT